MEMYQVICHCCGKVLLSMQEYLRQLGDANEVWRCPLCSCRAEFDDLYAEASERRHEFAVGQYVSFHRETYKLVGFETVEAAKAHGDRVFLILSDGIEEVE
jgi:hypothetical protein